MPCGVYTKQSLNSSAHSGLGATCYSTDHLREGGPIFNHSRTYLFSPPTHKMYTARCEFVFTIPTWCLCDIRSRGVKRVLTILRHLSIILLFCRLNLSCMTVRYNTWLRLVYIIWHSHIIITYWKQHCVFARILTMTTRAICRAQLIGASTVQIATARIILNNNKLN